MATGKTEARKVRRMSRQVVVALPGGVRLRLGVKPGAEVYWHRHRAGEVVLAATAERTAGTPGRHDLEQELTRVTAERDEYKRMALGLELGERRAVFAQGVEWKIGNEIPIRVRLDRLTEAVAEVLAHVRPVRRPHRPTGRGPGRSPSEPGPVSEEKKEAADVPVADPLDSRAGQEFSNSPPRAEE